MKKIAIVFLVLVMIFSFCGCENYIDRSFTAEQSAARFDTLFERLGEVLKNNGIPFSPEDIVSNDDGDSVNRSYSCNMQNGDRLDVWLNYSIGEEGTGRETFYAAVQTAYVDSFGDCYKNPADYRYLYEIGHCLSNMCSVNRSVKKADELVYQVRQQVLTQLGSSPNGVYRSYAALSNEYDLWNLSFSVHQYNDGEKYDSTFTYEGLVNVTIK